MVVDAYVRVSQVGGRSGERFISPSLQREQIEHWVRARGYVLGEIFEELDASGGRGDRPLLEEAIARIERGDSQGIVVAKIDRFGRSLANGLAAIERITGAGGVFAARTASTCRRTPGGSCCGSCCRWPNGSSTA